MAEPENIRRFNERVGYVFGVLYREFPRRIYVKPIDVVGYTFKDDKSPFDFDTHKFEAVDPETGADIRLSLHDMDEIDDTIIWLRDTGYIDYEDHNPHLYFSRVVLTAKGLEVLKVVPATLNASKSFGEQLGEIVAAGTKDVAATLVSQALTAGFAVLTS